MAGQIEPIARMAQQLSRLPGIGAKTAQRLAYYIVSLPEDQVHELASAIWQGRKAVKYCSVCGNYTVDDPCPICADEKRHNGVLCVVRDPRDVAAMERKLYCASAQAHGDLGHANRPRSACRRRFGVCRRGHACQSNGRPYKDVIFFVVNTNSKKRPSDRALF